MEGLEFLERRSFQIFGGQDILRSIPDLSETPLSPLKINAAHTIGDLFRSSLILLGHNCT